MKKYNVNVHYDTVLSVSVIAKSEEEALELASAKASQMSLNESEVVAENSCVTSVEEIQAGVFTVNDSGKKVIFAPGNLYWDGKKFAFEKHQYNFPKKYNPKHIGHFFWSKDAAVAVAKKYNDNNMAKKDSFFAIDGEAVKGWTMLSKEEWKYLQTHALAKNSRDKYDFVIAGVECAILLPDEIQSDILQDTYTASEWVKAESQYGLVALPFAGLRYDSDINGTGDYSLCWSSAPCGDYEDYAYYAYFNYYGASTGDYARFDGGSVRLVQVQQ